MLDCQVCIPARLGSRRLPNKLLRKVNQKTLLECTWERVNRQDYSKAPFVCTDSRQIEEECFRIGAPCKRFEGEFSCGTDRCAAACLGLDPEVVVVNVQADEVNLNPYAIEVTARAVSHGALVATVAAPLPAEQTLDPNVVKVVLNEARLAMYFSRSMLPWARETIAQPGNFWLMHVGVYAMKNLTLQNFAGWGPAAIELLEGLEQLRFLWHGTPIFVQTLGAHGRSINTETDLASLVRGEI